MWHITAGILALLILIGAIYVVFIKSFNKWKREKLEWQVKAWGIQLIGVTWILIWAFFGKFEPTMIEDHWAAYAFSVAFGLANLVTLCWVHLYASPNVDPNRMRNFGSEGRTF